jgi:uncharacterized protein (TIGR03437 family)
MKTIRLELCLVLLTTAPWASAQITFNTVPSRIVGQPILQQQGTLTAIAPNLVEGRELYQPNSVAIDTSASPPIVYVADTSNNRVLAWQNATAITKGNKADLVIGQRDFFTTAAKGPGTDLSTGLSAPVAVAVDSKGNLYVADAGNNRVVRYPTPFAQNSPLLPIDLLIGQADFTGRSPNQGQSGPTSQGLAFTKGTSLFRVGMAFDSQGNLWISDAANNRVLRFPVSNLAAGTTLPAADTVLGQSSFTTSALPANATANQKNFLAAPAGLGFDPSGNLFVADSANRVAVFGAPQATGMPITRIMGIVLPTQSQPTPPTINSSTLGSTGGPPNGVFFIGSNPCVVDTGNARILEYSPYSQWAPEATAFSPPAIAVLGQSDYVSNKSNQGLAAPTASSFSGPVGAHPGSTEANGVVAAAYDGTDLFIVDAGNNRVLLFPLAPSGSLTGLTANRVLGQVDFAYNSPNLIEGREFYLQGLGGSVVVDTVSSTPHLYVSDPGNSRILGFNDYRKVGPGVTADLVIGQPNLYTGMRNYPTNSATQLNNSGLSAPQGLAIDSSGNLWVADQGNGRVLRFPQPFAQPGGTQLTANLVVGQSSFFTKIPDASAATMSAPWGIAFTASGHLLVSDAVFNRILFFLKPQGGDFSNGQSAAGVIGQPGFGPPTETSLKSPLAITTDVDDRLYVIDSGNNRMVVYGNVPQTLAAGNDPQPTLSVPGLNNPAGVFSDPRTGDIWVADSGHNQVLRYPKFDQLVLSLTPTATLANVPGPLSVGLDAFSNPVVGESTNLVAFFYPALDYTNAAGGVSGHFSGNGANYFQEFAPAMLASIFALSPIQFTSSAVLASTVPLPTTLADTKVTVGGAPAPLLYVGMGQINFQVPSSTPTGGFQEIQVVRPSTGQILSSYLFRFNAVAPGLFSADSTGTGQLAAVNQDGTVNSAAHPAKAGSVISLYGTGIGVVPGAPADGTPNPNQPVSANQTTHVYTSGTASGQVPDSDISYSGLAPGFIGLWQINFKIPTDAPVSCTTQSGPVTVAVVYDNVNTRIDQFGDQRTTTICTTQ